MTSRKHISLELITVILSFPKILSLKKGICYFFSLQWIRKSARKSRSESRKDCAFPFKAFKAALTFFIYVTILLLLVFSITFCWVISSVLIYYIGLGWNGCVNYWWILETWSLIYLVIDLQFLLAFSSN